MRLFGIDITLAQKAEQISLDTLIQRLEAAYATASGVDVTPENCMESPTVNAVVTGLQRRISSLPLHVLRKSESDGRTIKERMPNHPVAILLAKPNDWQSSVNYFQDAVSSLIRYGNFFAFKSRGVTGPIRSLLPISAGQVAIEQDANWNLSYRASLPSGGHREHREYLQAQIHHVRGPARDFVTGNSPIMDARDSIALEIAAERFGGTFFGNGATPGLIFKFMAGFQGFRTDEERKKFIDDFQNIYAKKNRFKALMLPNGLEVADGPAVDNDKAQFLETRKLQRSIIAGVLGVPPHIVGDLDRATFSNIEEQSLDLVRSAILPICRTFESAMERDLLTPADRAGGIVIRFNLDGLLRGDFKSRQEGLAIQRMNGVINADEWREKENENPRQDGGGEVYWDQGPSGQRGASSAEDGGE